MKAASLRRPTTRESGTALCRGLGAELVEGTDQFAGDLLCRRLFNDEALHEVDQFSIAQNGYGRRGGRIAFEVAARSLSSVAILSGEDCDFAIGLIGRVGQSESHSGAHFARGTTTDRVNHKKGRSGLGYGGIHLVGRASFCDSGAHEFFTHGNDHQFWVHVTSGKGSFRFACSYSTEKL